MVTNVQIVRATATEVTVQSRFLVYRNRLQDETDFFIGKREDVLRKVDGAWKIARRHIMLDQNVLLAKNLTVFFGSRWPGVRAVPDGSSAAPGPPGQNRRH
jgi:3-phenylpropionate/cinnamic acid dioxygenase small subunit